jgi:hypothetical protein
MAFVQTKMDHQPAVGEISKAANPIVCVRRVTNHAAGGHRLGPEPLPPRPCRQPADPFAFVIEAEVQRNRPRNPRPAKVEARRVNGELRE